MAGENKWPLSRKITAIVFVAIIAWYHYRLYIGETNLAEDFRDYLKFGLPAFVFYIVYQRNKAKKKRQDKQEADTGKTFQEKHDIKSSD